MQRFEKKRRLLHKKEFDVVFSQANKTITSEFVILHKKNSQETARLGLAISKKLVPRAVDRNRLKRLLRESFRVSELIGIDVVVLARQGAYKADNEKIMLGLRAAWKKLSGFYAS